MNNPKLPISAMEGRLTHADGLPAAATVCIAVAALTASAKTSVPFWPVPLTLQSLTLVIVALTLGPHRGAISVLTYVGLGVAGIPVFASGSQAGWSYLLGPTGGYLLSMPIAAWAMARLHEVRENQAFLWTATCAFLGSALVLACGTIWLAFVLGTVARTPSIDFYHAFSVGCRPFLVGDGFKALLAASLVQAWPRRLRPV